MILVYMYFIADMYVFNEVLVHIVVGGRRFWLLRLSRKNFFKQALAVTKSFPPTTMLVQEVLGVK